MIFNNSSITTAWACAAILAGALSMQACAVPEASLDERPHTKVQFADLNLNTREGVDALYHRIRGAARTVCNVAIPQTDVRNFRDWSACFDETVADAVSKVNNARLTLRHAQATNRRVG
jgi:UrcA family protein